MHRLNKHWAHAQLVPLRHPKSCPGLTFWHSTHQRSVTMALGWQLPSLERTKNCWGSRWVSKSTICKVDFLLLAASPQPSALPPPCPPPPSHWLPQDPGPSPQMQAVAIAEAMPADWPGRLAEDVDPSRSVRLGLGPAPISLAPADWNWAMPMPMPCNAMQCQPRPCAGLSPPCPRVQFNSTIIMETTAPSSSRTAHS